MLTFSTFLYPALIESKTALYVASPGSDFQVPKPTSLTNNLILHQWILADMFIGMNLEKI